MKKQFIVIALLLSLITSLVEAQDAKTVKKYFDNKEWANAKTAVDQFVTTKPSGEAWFWKARVYYELSKEDALKGAATAGEERMEAFKAFQEAYKVNKKEIEEAKIMGASAEQLGNKFGEASNLLFNLYSGAFDEGAKAFNAKEYEKAFYSFKNTDAISKFIAINKLLELPLLDTNVVFYAAAAGDAAQKKRRSFSILQKVSRYKNCRS